MIASSVTTSVDRVAVHVRVSFSGSATTIFGFGASNRSVRGDPALPAQADNSSVSVIDMKRLLLAYGHVALGSGLVDGSSTLLSVTNCLSVMVPPTAVFCTLIPPHMIASSWISPSVWSISCAVTLFVTSGERRSGTGGWEACGLIVAGGFA